MQPTYLLGIPTEKYIAGVSNSSKECQAVTKPTEGVRNSEKENARERPPHKSPTLMAAPLKS